MEIFETEDDFGAVKAGTILCEAFVALEMVKEFSTVDVIHDKEEFVRGLEGIVEVDEERMAELLQDALLGTCVFQLVSLDDCGLVEDLHGVDLAVVLLSHLHDLQHNKTQSTKRQTTRIG